MTRNQGQLDTANRLIVALFDDELSLQGEGPLVDAVTMKTRSKAKSVDYHFLHSFDNMREWIGERRIADFGAETFTIPNKKYESSLRVDRVDVESDSLGLYEPQVRNRVQGYFRLRRQLVADLLENGQASTNTGYDGVPFFSQAHPNDSGADQSNYETTFPLTGENFDTAVQQGQELLNHAGDPMDITYDTIVVGPKLRATARNLFQITNDYVGSNPDAAAVTSNAGSNPYFGVVKVIVDPYITSNDWYLFDSSKALKALVLQDADDLEMQTLTSINDEYVIMNDAFFYGTRARFGVGYGFWQLAFKGNTD